MWQNAVIIGDLKQTCQSTGSELKFFLNNYWYAIQPGRFIDFKGKENFAAMVGSEEFNGMALKVEFQRIA